MRTSAALLVLLLAAGCAVDPLETHVRTLAAPEYEGRETGTPGERKAGDYIAARLREAGIEPRFQVFRGHGTTGRNVIGIVKGESEEAVLVGAHYDHLGLSKNGVNHGADDNASGTAVVVELARRFAASPARRTLVFLLFSGEEMGLLGSKAYVREPAVPLERSVAMVNLDMVGRYRGRLSVFGADTGDRFRAYLADAPFHLAFGRDAVGPSDHTSFVLKGIPSLHLFTGSHPDYHKPGDVAEKINYEGLREIADFTETLVRRIADAPERMAFVKPEISEEPSVSPVPGATPYFGLMPDYAFEGRGVRLDAVTPGSPAEKAGLREGDVIKSLNGTPVEDVKVYSSYFYKMKPGDAITLEVERDRKPVTVKAVLAARRRSSEE